MDARRFGRVGSVPAPEQLFDARRDSGFECRMAGKAHEDRAAESTAAVHELGRLPKEAIFTLDYVDGRKGAPVPSDNLAVSWRQNAVLIRFSGLHRPVRPIVEWEPF